MEVREDTHAVEQVCVVRLAVAKNVLAGGRRDHAAQHQAVGPEAVDHPLELALEVEPAAYDEDA